MSSPLASSGSDGEELHEQQRPEGHDDEEYDLELQQRAPSKKGIDASSQQKRKERKKKKKKAATSAAPAGKDDDGEDNSVDFEEEDEGDDDDEDLENPRARRKRDSRDATDDSSNDALADSGDDKSRSSSSGMDGHHHLKPKFIPVSLSFRHVFFSVTVRKGKNPFGKRNVKTLLKDVNGELHSGEVTAIMGPSGAGKTTLLNLLAGRVQSGKIKGEITVNGIPKKEISRKVWQRLCSYIMQDDILFPMLTVRETFWFSAQLKLPFREKKKEQIDSLIEELGLESCQKTKIGNELRRGVSGGQRKRASIGTEMITDPSILFLDEPTSGLDSSTAYSLVEKLKRLASLGRTIVTTVHQPSTDIFFKFDKLILLADGHVVYNGFIKDVVSYFATLGYKCPRYTNPAEYIMDLVKADSHISTKEEGEARVKHLIQAYRKANNLPELTEDESFFADGINREDIEFAPLQKKAHSLSKSTIFRKLHKSNNVDDHDIKKIEVRGGPNFFWRWLLLVFRAILMQARDPMQIPARFAQALFLALLVGLLYLQIGDNQVSIGDREGSLFFVVMSMSMGSMMSSMVAFQVERPVFIREHSTGCYTTGIYYLAKMVADFPFLTFVPIVQGTITYWMVGYQAVASKYFIFIAACIMVAIVAHSLGLCLSAASPTLQIAMALGPALFIPLMLLGGFFINSGSIPDWLIWAKYFSPFKYGFQILAQNEFTGLTFTCSASSTSCTTTGEQELSTLDLNNNQGSIWASFLFLFMQYFFFHSVAYFLLRVTAGRKKG